MRVLMLVWTGVATDTRVLREAGALVEAGHVVHIIGRAVPADFTPPEGITVESAGVAPSAQGRTRELRGIERLARWALLPQHRARRLLRWQREATELARAWASRVGRPDVVHAHDFTALPVGVELAEEWFAALVYDSHEYWVGRPLEGRPAPLRSRGEARREARLGVRAAAVITVGEGVARQLRVDHPDWPEITVVRNTFPVRDVEVASPPTAAVYAGRLAADRELETIAAASVEIDLPITLVGPGDAAWLSRFDPGRATVLPAEPVADVDARLAAAGIALVTHSDRWQNHRLAMPNKLFHAVSLGVPVVATDVGELALVVGRHGLGAVYPPGDPGGLADAVRRVSREHEAYRERVRAAREDLTWSTDARALLDVYTGVGHR